MKKIAVFNHKGRVSKTVTCYHLGWSIAKAGKKVLLVDADSQCNLTMYALGEDKYSKLNPENNIYCALRPAFKSQITLIQPVDCPQIGDNLFLMPGHLNFTEIEMQLSVAMQLFGSLRSMENLPGAINCLVEQTAEKFGIDYVLFDMNPSFSAINQDIFICCDCFMIPTSPDLFSSMSIQSLTRVLPSWERWAIQARESFKDAIYPLPDSSPKFLGYTVNNFKLSDGRPRETFQGFMNKLANQIERELIPALQKQNMAFDRARYQAAYENMEREIKRLDYPSPYCLAQIPDFNQLIALSHEQFLPIFEVKLPSVPSEEQIETQQRFKRLYPALARRVLELVSDEQ